ncbi:MAG TPA: hypothetical protein VM324_04680 [Egibacteraceae bacterium]|jgi:hypothetical protein|nr:hypothetical protein [Egibacteraceae bacterium]
MDPKHQPALERPRGERALRERDGGSPPLVPGLLSRAPQAPAAWQHGMLQEQLRALHGRSGNASVAGLVASIQRQEAPAADGAQPAEQDAAGVADAAAPGLTADVATRAREAMAANRRQEAITIIVDHLVETGVIDRNLLRGGRMRYDAGLNQEGAATIPRFRLVEGRRVANPTRVRIGRTAFGQGLPWLYSSIIHEYRHVEQFQHTFDAETRPTSGHNDWLEARQEADAYLHEIESSRTTGLFNNPRQMRETWRRLHAEHWVNVDRAGRRALGDRYEAAHAIAQGAVGADVQLPFSPARAPVGAP